MTRSPALPSSGDHAILRILRLLPGLSRAELEALAAYLERRAAGRRRPAPQRRRAPAAR